jgi:choloylglycine hydrolase
MNKNKSVYILISAFTCLSLSPVAQSNTLVFWNDNNQAKIVSRTMDLKENEFPLLRSSPRGVTRIGDIKNNHASWKAKYGSVVVTAYNTNATTDGINDQGLSVHVIPMPQVDYGINRRDRPALTNALWVQYMLDNYKTVKEALAGLNQYQLVHSVINEKELHSHLALQDATGDSAIIEFVNGKPKVYHGKQFNVMTNHLSPDIQKQQLSLYTAFGGERQTPGEYDANSRFIRASANLKLLPPPSNPLEAMSGLDSVMRTTMVPPGNDAAPTRWVSTSDLSNRVFYFNTTTTPGVLWIDLKKLNLKENASLMVIDPKRANLSGDVTRQFKPEKKS